MFELKEIANAIDAKLVRTSNYSSFKGVSTDSRTIKKGDVFFALKGDNFDGHDFIKDALKKGAKAVVISKEKKEIKQNVNVLKVKNTTVALGKLAKYKRKKHNIPLIAVTGSTGKTTTKDYIYDILTADYRALKNFGTHNNQIGVPETIFKINNRHEICVLELGSNHFGEISYLSSIAQPQVAVITNIGASHLEFLKDLKGVFKEKKSISSHLKKPKIVLLNGDDGFLRKIKLSKDFKVFFFGQKEGCDFRASNICIESNRLSFVFNKKHKFCLNSLGRFNIHNALAAIACGIIFGIGIKDIKKALGNFQFPQKRLNKINCHKFSIIDDTYNSNPLSLEKAIESLVEYKTRGRRILIMGDMLELGESSLELHRQMGKFISQKPLDVLITLGEFSRITADEAQIKSKNLRSVFTFDSKSKLIHFLRTRIKFGDVLLIKGSRLLRMEDITNSLIKME
ncbi:UDP-N-acetylmuramoyl-tripeptide--D-alanyl-D-alanine ligase [Candidatus Omnitrophota bacterium]